jgi:hypothetical protein
VSRAPYVERIERAAEIAILASLVLWPLAIVLFVLGVRLAR